MILNLTQHAATPDQIAAGVIEPNPYEKAVIRQMLTFDAPPDQKEMDRRGRMLARMIHDYRFPGNGRTECRRAMIGGAPFFMSTLEEHVKGSCMIPVYAFSRREADETQRGDGSVEKRQIFRHAGFVEVLR